jgi:hypothetical protein
MSSTESRPDDYFPSMRKISISEALAGVCCVRIDRICEPARLRATYATDDDIAQTAADYAPRRALDGEALFQAAEHDVDAQDH